MPRIKYHKLAAVIVLAATAGWILTGEFSSVGSAIPERESQPAEDNKPAVETPLRTVAVVVPPRTMHARTIRVSGTTEANKRTRLAARVGGIVSELPVEKGSPVDAGDLIMRLDAEGKVAAVDMAKAMLAQREAEAEAAERLAKSGNMAKLRLDGAQTALAQARSQLEGAEAELARNTVRAPFAGLVDRVAVEKGSAILQGAEIATVLSLDPILAVGQVSEHDLAELEIGNTATVRLVNGRSLEGTLRYISREASPQTRTFRVEIAIANPQLEIPAGMTAEISLRADKVQSVFLPRSVVTLSETGDLGVRTVTPQNIVDFVPIDLIDDTPQGLVLGGIPDDARIIVAGQDLVKTGDEVNAVEADAETVKRLVGQLAGSVN
ncbi:MULTISPECIES: efflux RND transporter periplasmic adaptor subunit [Nitratireductor]|uniref:efflux RND transporter periplasmic adaptor subunit n=1 Tax=Nitratireductor TaxID=245876 RepID=UPI000D0D6C38|nr:MULTISPECIES: efflux RND transporter periplasmic adaptor subunit [Nitratireductor]PSM19223.1 efflux transporter periplasmic adaptor subunit [Nitratireductor sp. StC3]